MKRVQEREFYVQPFNQLICRNLEYIHPQQLFLRESLVPTSTYKRDVSTGQTLMLEVYYSSVEYSLQKFMTGACVSYYCNNAIIRIRCVELHSWHPFSCQQVWWMGSQKLMKRPVVGPLMCTHECSVELKINIF